MYNVKKIQNKIGVFFIELLLFFKNSFGFQLQVKLSFQNPTEYFTILNNSVGKLIGYQNIANKIFKSVEDAPPKKKNKKRKTSTTTTNKNTKKLHPD